MLPLRHCKVIDRRCRASDFDLFSLAQSEVVSVTQMIELLTLELTILFDGSISRHHPRRHSHLAETTLQIVKLIAAFGWIVKQGIGIKRTALPWCWYHSWLPSFPHTYRPNSSADPNCTAPRPLALPWPPSAPLK
jgi:hypothetical protein